MFFSRNRSTVLAFLVGAAILATPAAASAGTPAKAKPAAAATGTPAGAKPAPAPAAASAAAPAAAPTQAPEAVPGGSDTTPTIASIGDRSITLAEVDALAASALLEVRQNEYKVRKEALDNLINGELVKKEAATRGLELNALLEQEVGAKVAEPTAKEIDDFYEQNKARMGGATREQVGDKIGEYLKSQKLAEAQMAYLHGLREKYGVQVLLEPPRVQVADDDDATRGPAEAPVTIVEFSDYQCPYCSHAEATMQEVLKKYGEKVRLVYRDYPLSFHANAQLAAEASECARAQGKFWEMHDAMFAHQDKLDAEGLVDQAKALGLNKKKFKACLDEGQFKEEVKRDFEDGVRAGVTGTPTFFINGIPVTGAQGLNAFEEVIDEELARNP